MVSKLDKITAWLKKYWYHILLAVSSIYVFYHRNDIYQLKELNAYNLIFLIWLLLLLSPLFSEMEFLGVKIKKEVEKANKEVNSSLKNIQSQISQIQMSNLVATNINVGNTPLPSEKKIEEMLQIVRELQSTHPNTNMDLKNSATGDQSAFLFKIRLNIETFLRELCEKMGYTNKTSAMMMAQFLNRKEVINGMTYDLIRQVIRIANRGVHGEIVSEQYISFVEKSYPEIIRQLSVVSSQLVKTYCPHCGYSGYSTDSHVCPQCGHVDFD